MFENVAHVEFHEREYDRILSCISREGEVVKVGISCFVTSMSITQFDVFHGLALYRINVSQEPENQLFIILFFILVKIHFRRTMYL